MGHTPQLSGANCECDGSVWRIDVGMSGGVLNSPVQVRGRYLRVEAGRGRSQMLSLYVELPWSNATTLQCYLHHLSLQPSVTFLVGVRENAMALTASVLGLQWLEKL